MLPFILLWQIIFPKMLTKISPMPHALLQHILVLQLSQEVVYYLDPGRSSDCSDQENLMKVMLCQFWA